MRSLSPKTLAATFFEKRHRLIQDHFWLEKYGELYEADGRAVLEAVEEYGSAYVKTYPEREEHKKRIENICQKFAVLHNTGYGNPEEWHVVLQHLQEMKAVQEALIASLNRSLQEYAKLFGGIGDLRKAGYEFTDLDTEALGGKGARQRGVALSHTAACEALNALNNTIELAAQISAGLVQQQAGGRGIVKDEQDEKPNE